MNTEKYREQLPFAARLQVYENQIEQLRQSTVIGSPREYLANALQAAVDSLKIIPEEGKLIPDYGVGAQAALIYEEIEYLFPAEGNKSFSDGDFTGHAEIRELRLVRSYGKELLSLLPEELQERGIVTRPRPGFPNKFKLATTMEPCRMCTDAIANYQGSGAIPLTTIIIGAEDETHGAFLPPKNRFLPDTHFARINQISRIGPRVYTNLKNPETHKALVYSESQILGKYWRLPIDIYNERRSVSQLHPEEIQELRKQVEELTLKNLGREQLAEALQTKNYFW